MGLQCNVRAESCIPASKPATGGRAESLTPDVIPYSLLRLVGPVLDEEG